MFKLISGIVMGLLYVGAGINHFVKPGLYLKIMPPRLPAPVALNYVAGAAEMGLALLLPWPVTRPWAAWGLVALLVAVFPANIYMYQTRRAFRVPAWALLLRLPLQFVLLAWAAWYTF